MKTFLILFVFFVVSSCSPETSNNISEAIKNISRIGLESYKYSLNNRGTTNNSSSNTNTSCMWNPSTQGMSQCFHVTATGKCAHYGGPC